MFETRSHCPPVRYFEIQRRTLLPLGVNAYLRQRNSRKKGTNKKKGNEASRKKTRRHAGGRKRTREIKKMGIKSMFVDSTTNLSKFRVAVSICAI